MSKKRNATVVTDETIKKTKVVKTESPADVVTKEKTPKKTVPKLVSDAYVFLGGTCNGSTWRDSLMPLLDEADIKYFNPVVEDWTEECMAIEEVEKFKSTHELYIISPEMIGVYSIAEAVKGAFTKPESTIFCYIDNSHNPLASDTFTEAEKKSLAKTAEIIADAGGKVCSSFEEIIEYINR